MAVTESKLINIDAEIAFGDDEFGQVYRVKTDSLMLPDQVYAQAIAAGPTAVPQVGSSWPTGGGAVCLGVRLRLEHEGNKFIWLATARYGPLPQQDNSQGDPGQPPIEDPLARPPRYRLDREPTTELVEKDAAGDPIVNDAQQPFEEPPTRQRNLLVLIVENNYATWEEIAQISDDYDQAVNAAQFHLWGPRQVRFAEIVSSSRQYENATTYYVGTMRLVIKPETWDRQFFNQGWKHWDKAPVFDAAGEVTNGAKLVNARQDGQLVSEPVKLAKDGTRLPDGAKGTFTGPVQINPAKDFSALGV